MMASSGHTLPTSLGSISDVINQLNISAEAPYEWLRSFRSGPALAAVAKAYTGSGKLLMEQLGWNCRFFGARHVTEFAAQCSAEGECFAPSLHTTVKALTTRLQRVARGVVYRLCFAGAPASLVALVAALDSTASHYPSVTTECLTLADMLDTLESAGRQCGSLVDMGLQCSNSLYQAATLSGSAIHDIIRLEESDMKRKDWTYVGLFGRSRADILGGLLESLGAKEQRTMMAEIGVFQANTSTRLMERFPHLHMLLVDPYHLHTEDPEANYQQMDEFYVAPASIFESAVQWTQPYRARATHILQESGEAARWIGQNSLHMVFIDGDHRFESVTRDMNTFWALLRPGGVLAGHDFALNFPGVVEAVTKFAMMRHLRLFIAPEVTVPSLTDLTRLGSCYLSPGHQSKR